MIGYWRDDAATRAVMKPGRWLAMGDIGCLHDGRLYIGAREIEYRLDAHPVVRESAVIGVDDPETGQAIRAVVVLADGATASVEELRTWCREAMAGYKVPTQWVIRRDPLPRNPSGKIVKRDLEADAAAEWARPLAPVPMGPAPMSPGRPRRLTR
jgi:acyl-CoA synthetase (AMP-forming)/AMP-acid ligase II